MPTLGGKSKQRPKRELLYSSSFTLSYISNDYSIDRNSSQILQNQRNKSQINVNRIAGETLGKGAEEYLDIDEGERDQFDQRDFQEEEDDDDDDLFEKAGADEFFRNQDEHYNEEDVRLQN